MRVETKPWAGGVLAALLWILLCCIAIFVYGCAAAARPVVEARTAVQRDAASVAIYGACGGGSGVLVSGTVALTAAHVVACHGLTPPVLVRTLDGPARVALVDAVDTARDLARLTILESADNVPALTVRAARAGERVCVSAIVPEATHACGIVDRVGRAPREQGDLDTSLPVWFGNSGGGVYGDDGALVGLVARMEWCSKGDEMLWTLMKMRPPKTCGSLVTSIHDSAVKP